jgi:hypothetical protein
MGGTKAVSSEDDRFSEDFFIDLREKFSRGVYLDNIFEIEKLIWSQIYRFPVLKSFLFVLVKLIEHMGRYLEGEPLTIEKQAEMNAVFVKVTDAISDLLESSGNTVHFMHLFEAIDIWMEIRKPG